MSLTIEKVLAAKKFLDEWNVQETGRFMILKYFHHPRKRMRKKNNRHLAGLGYKGKSWKRFLIDYCHVQLPN